MRLRRPLAALAVAALVAVPACDVAEERALAPLDDTAPVPTAPPVRPPATLCDAIPHDVVAAETGRSPVTVDGAGSQCSWRAGTDGADGGQDVVLQGSFIDASSFEVGRRDGTAAAVPGLGDDAYVVRSGDPAAPTLYVLDGSRAFALWLGGAAPAEPEEALARLARQVLAS